MRILKTNILLLVGLALLLVGCAKGALPGHSIMVKVTASDTKGTVTTTDGLKASGAFSMMAYLSDDYNEYDSKGDITRSYDLSSVSGKYIDGAGNVTLGASGWIIAGEPKWISRVDTHFWAWHPVSVSGRSTPVPVLKTPADGDPKYPYTGELTFSYTTPTVDGATDADKAVDLLFAYTKKRYVNPGPKDPEPDATVNITFHHALAQVRFCVSTDDGTFDKGLKIKSISISNLKTSGNGSFTDSGNAEKNEYAYSPTDDSYDQFVWTGQTGSASFGQTYNADFSTSSVSGWTTGSYTKDGHTYNLYTCENVFFLIPQAVTSTNKMTVVFEYKGAEIERAVDIADASGVEWLGDRYYTYKIKATTLGRDIDFNVSLVGWSNRKEEIFI